jgi:hypothetical protein
MNFYYERIRYILGRNNQNFNEMTTQITEENLLALKKNIEMRLGSKLQEMGWDLGNEENKIVIFKLEMPNSR